MKLEGFENEVWRKKKIQRMYKLQVWELHFDTEPMQ